MLAAEATAFANALPDPRLRERYTELARVAAAGEAIPAELIGPLETMLELLAQKGRAHGVLLRVFARTPHGRELTSAARDVSTALAALKGQQLANVNLAATPGRNTLTLETDRCRLTVELDAAGARVTSLET